MPFTIQAACHCQTGLVRENNEDNFFFDDLSLQERNAGLSKPLTASFSTEQRKVLAVFDGMGGENYGETASFVAAQALFAAVNGISCDGDGDFSQEAALQVNQAVWDRAVSLGTDRMGSTLAMLTFRQDHVYACNLGDSRIFRLRDGKFHQLSEDHTDEKFILAQGIQRRPQLTQHLGINPAEIRVEPHVSGFFLQHGDWYLICSDGLTDMLNPGQIAEHILAAADPAQCAGTLLEAAIAQGGQDNITVIVCHVE